MKKDYSWIIGFLVFLAIIGLIVVEIVGDKDLKKENESLQESLSIAESAADESDRLFHMALKDIDAYKLMFHELVDDLDLVLVDSNSDDRFYHIISVANLCKNINNFHELNPSLREDYVCESEGRTLCPECKRLLERQ